jgi:hypothetical protein
VNGLDRWITGGRRSTELLAVQCPECEEWTQVTATTEYGATDWDPEECGSCGLPLPEDARTEDAEPEPPEPDDYDDTGRFHPWV